MQNRYLFHTIILNNSGWRILWSFDEKFRPITSGLNCIGKFFKWEEFSYVGPREKNQGLRLGLSARAKSPFPAQSFLNFSIISITLMKVCSSNNFVVEKYLQLQNIDLLCTRVRYWDTYLNRTIIKIKSSLIPISISFFCTKHLNWKVNKKLTIQCWCGFGGKVYWMYVVAHQSPCNN